MASHCCNSGSFHSGRTASDNNYFLFLLCCFNYRIFFRTHRCVYSAAAYHTLALIKACSEAVHGAISSIRFFRKLLRHIRICLQISCHAIKSAFPSRRIFSPRGRCLRSNFPTMITGTDNTFFSSSVRYMFAPALCLSSKFPLESLLSDRRFREVQVVSKKSAYVISEPVVSHLNPSAPDSSSDFTISFTSSRLWHCLSSMPIARPSSMP